MNNAFEAAFKKIFSAPKNRDRTIDDQSRSKPQSSATTPPLPTEANERASTTKSEQPQGERHE